MTMSQELLSEFDPEMKRTRKALERLPDDRFDWKPHAKSTSAGRLAGHIAELPGFSAGIMKTESLSLGNSDANPAPMKNCAEVLALFDKNAAEAREAIAAATDDYLSQQWHLSFQGKKMFEAPRAAALRSSIRHLVHHRGQLTVYLRLNDIPVPAIYGPSADEM
jgi:uncharacterized damage-inducible protein DinB